MDDIVSIVVASYPTINAEAIAEHLRLVRKQHGPSETVYLILDRAPYHRAEIVTEEVEKLIIKIKFLPACSPNLNPIEWLWKVMNEKVGIIDSSKVLRTLDRKLIGSLMKYYLI